MDVHSPEVRSYNMSQIKGKNTKPEEIVRKYLYSKGFRFRKNVNKLPGKPDVVLPKYHTVIFVNGCFWHGHDGCKYFVMPKSNVDFWENKIKSNILRDMRNIAELEKMGWHVIIVWECQLKQKKKIETMENLISILKLRSEL